MSDLRPLIRQLQRDPTAADFGALLAAVEALPQSDVALPELGSTLAAVMEGLALRHEIHLEDLETVYLQRREGPAVEGDFFDAFVRSHQEADFSAALGVMDPLPAPEWSSGSGSQVGEIPKVEALRYVQEPEGEGEAQSEVAADRFRRDYSEQVHVWARQLQPWLEGPMEFTRLVEYSGLPAVQVLLVLLLNPLGWPLRFSQTEFHGPLQIRMERRER